MLASHKGYHNIVEMLLDKGASMDSRNNFGETPLFYASRRGFPTVVRLLLELGRLTVYEVNLKIWHKMAVLIREQDARLMTSKL